MSKIDIYHSCCFDFLATLSANHVDIICIDPPYGLINNKIETNIDKDRLHKELYRVLKPNNFYMCFGIQPTLTDWTNSAQEAGFKAKQEFIWVKQTSSNQFMSVSRMHENIIVFQKGHRPFNKVFVKEQNSIPRHTTEKIQQSVDAIKKLIAQKRYDELFDACNGRPAYPNPSSKNFDHYNRGEQKYGAKPDNDTLDARRLLCGRVMPTVLYHDKPNYGITSYINHPTVKPITLIQDLLKLGTNTEGRTLVLDCFLGSGTTALACKYLDLDFVGCELYEEYYNLAKTRLDSSLL